MIPDYQLARGIQAKRIRAWGLSPRWVGVGGEAPNEPEGLRGAEPPKHKFCSEFVQVLNSLRILSTKSTIVCMLMLVFSFICVIETH